MRSFRHWTPHYVACRIRQIAHQRIHPSEPWLTADAVRILRSLLRSSDVGFEWGSGRSTPWFAARIRHLTSIENNPTWHERVRSQLELGGARNVDHELHETPQAEGQAAATSYVKAIERYADASLDFVLVDGWARDYCALASIDKLKRGGVLVIDDAHRYLTVPSWVIAPGARTAAQGSSSSKWDSFLEHVASWRFIWTDDGISPTLILIRTA